MTIDGPSADRDRTQTSGGETIRILLADDHNLVRDGIRSLLESRLPNVEVVMAANLGDALAAVATPLGFDLVLLDFRMPGMDGTEGIERMRASLPTVPVVILSGYTCPPELYASLTRLNVGFLPKTLSGDALISRLCDVMDGGSTAVAADHAGLAESGGVSGPSDARPLTRRERQVLSHLSLGLSNKEIARCLTIEEVTVRLHLRGIFRKLGVRNRTQAVRHAIDHGLDIGSP